MAQPVVPAVPQIPAGYAPVAADMTLWVTTPFSFLASPVVFRAQLQGGQSLAGGTLTLMQLDTVLEDPWSGWNAGTWTWTVPAGCAGWYEVTLGITSGAQATPSQLQADLYVNGSRYQVAAVGWAVTGHDSGASGPPPPVPLVPGDQLQMYGYASSATSTPATAGQYPTMEIAWISA